MTDVIYLSINCRYVLSNALCQKYFGGSHEIADLQKAIAGYVRSDTLGGAGNPDLHFNYGNVLTYTQSFAEAIDRYNKSVAIDPGLPDAPSSVKNISAFLERLKKSVTSKQYNLTNLTLEADVVKDLQQSPLSKGTSGFADLVGGINAGLVFSAKFVAPIQRPDDLPSPEIFWCIDGNGDYGVVSVYNLVPLDAAKCGRFKTIAIADPVLKTWSLGAAASPVSGQPAGKEAGCASVDATSSAAVAAAGLSCANVFVVQAFEKTKVRIDGSAFSKATPVTSMGSSTFDV